MNLLDVCEKTYFPLNLRIRCKHTKDQYRYSIKNLSTFLRRDATLADLSDDNVTGMMRMLLDKGLDPHTVNGRKERINALWTWIAKRGDMGLSKFPTVQNLPEPHRIPRAWSESDLADLYEAAGKLDGFVGRVPSSIWWSACLWLCWNTGERIGAILRAEWDHLDHSILSLPFAIRKGGVKEAAYELWPETIAALKDVRRYAADNLLLPFPYSEPTLYHRMAKLLRKAGLPVTRYTRFQKIRRTFATQLHKKGGDATNAMQHSSESTTRAHYLDPFHQINQPQDLLPKLDSMREK